MTNDVTATAVWTVNKYTLTYNANAGKVASKSKQVTFGDKIGSLPKVTRKGYVLKGWYTKKTSGTKLTSASKYDTEGNATIYAQWTKVSVNATKVSKVKSVAKQSFQLALKKVSGVICPLASLLAHI